jgi:tetratricopeptide (TPR) repeat protein
MAAEKEAEKGNSQNREYEFNRAVALREMCNFAEARATFYQYVQAYPTDVDGHYNLGVVDQMLGRWDEAVAQYEIVINSGKTGERAESALYNSGVASALKRAETSDPIRQKRLEAVAIDYLERSLNIGGSGRINTIRAALVPLHNRPEKCRDITQPMIYRDYPRAEHPSRPGGV